MTGCISEGRSTEGVVLVSDIASSWEADALYVDVMIRNGGELPVEGERNPFLRVQLDEWPANRTSLGEAPGPPARETFITVANRGAGPYEPVAPLYANAPLAASLRAQGRNVPFLSADFGPETLTPNETLSFRFGLMPQANSGSVYAAKIWIYGHHDGGNDLAFRLATSTCFTPGVNPTWHLDLDPRLACAAP